MAGYGQLLKGLDWLDFRGEWFNWHYSRGTTHVGYFWPGGINVFAGAAVAALRALHGIVAQVAEDLGKKLPAKAYERLKARLFGDLFAVGATALANTVTGMSDKGSVAEEGKSATSVEG